MYQAVYKCRMCGEEFGDCMAEEEITEMANVALSVVGNTNHIKCAGNLYKNITHSCKDGSYGFADFQGFKKTEG